MTREELLKIIDEAAREQSPELDLADSGIRELPEEIGQLANLRELHLDGNQLTALPESIGQLGKLHAVGGLEDVDQPPRVAAVRPTRAPPPGGRVSVARRLFIAVQMPAPALKSDRLAGPVIV